uniref:Vacuolar protein sorting-associated protein 11 homolog n=1 Tax=Anisakis pegreffii TaxID=303229 RepID=A0A3G6JBC8_9BILA|nr:vacuolar protein sorting-associated protein 11 homolog [Anisakis pegreffii]
MSLVELGWRQFTFFEKRAVMDPQNPTEKFKGLENMVACCSQSGDGFTLFGEPGGAIFKLSKKLDEYCWIAHKRTLACICLCGNILATVGEDEEGVNSLVKLWHMDRCEKEAPFCGRVIRACQLLESSSCHPQACIVTLHSSLQHFAIGFSDSSVIYYHGNLLKEKPTKWLTIVNGTMSGTGDEVSGLAIAWLQSKNACVLYVMTSVSVQSFVISNKVIIKTVMHDAKGCLRDCWSFSEEDNRLVVGSTEMVHFYEAEQSLLSDIDGGRGKCHALGRSNQKVQLKAFNNYVTLLSKQPSSMCSSQDNWTFVLSVYDVEGQCVAFSCALPSVSRIFLLDSSLMILSADGTLSHLIEKHIKTKLDLLLKKNLFDLAVGLAKRSPVGNEYLPDICTKYGDYLFVSGDFENAVKQYVETIGSLEPSYVIKKFLDGSRIKELCSYLEMLHKKGQATAQHTTILINCYAKLGARHKIDLFIKQKLSCDVDVAVQVLRGANFTVEACRLCEENGLHDTLLSIHVDDCAEYAVALACIEKMDDDLVEKYLEKYGKLLLEKCPEQTMNFLVKLIASNDKIDATHLMKMFVGDTVHCSRFVELALQADRCNSKLRDIVLELRLRQWMVHRREDSGKQEMNTDEIVALIGDSDLPNALQICQMFDFAPGIVHIYTSLERFDELIEYHMRQNNLKEVFELCERNGSRKLWIDAIIFASREDNIDANILQYLLESYAISELVSLHLSSPSKRSLQRTFCSLLFDIFAFSKVD